MRCQSGLFVSNEISRWCWSVPSGISQMLSPIVTPQDTPTGRSAGEAMLLVIVSDIPVCKYNLPTTRSQLNKLFPSSLTSAGKIDGDGKLEIMVFENP